MLGVVAEVYNKETPNKEQGRQTLVLLSPGLQAADPVTNHCVMVRYSVTFDGHNASLEFVAREADVEMNLETFSGIMHETNKTTYVDLPSSVRRMLIVARVRQEEWASLAQIKVQQSTCQELFNVMGK